MTSLKHLTSLTWPDISPVSADHIMALRRCMAVLLILLQFWFHSEYCCCYMVLVPHHCRTTRGSKGPSRRPQGPLLTNTTLTVLRHCGKYLQMSRLLRTVAMDVIISLSQLFQYYLFTVHALFTADLVSNIYIILCKKCGVKFYLP